MKLWVFDLLTGNYDRHGGNFLVKDGKVYAIDHGCAFSGYNTSPFKSFPGEALPQDLVGKFERFLQWEEGQAILRDLLAEQIGSEKAKTCLKRIKYIGNILVQRGKLSYDEVSKIDKDYGYGE